MLVANLLFTRVFVFIYRYLIRNYVMIFQSLIYTFEVLKMKKIAALEGNNRIDN